MKRKIRVITIILILILSGLMVVSVNGIKTKTTYGDKKIENCDLYGADRWGLLIGRSGIMRSALLNGGFKENNIRMVDENGKLDDVFNAYSWLAQSSDENDIILIYLNGHGKKGEMYPGNCVIEYDILDENLDQIKYKGVIIVINACFSGSAIPILQQDNRIIFTAMGEYSAGGFQGVQYNGLTEAADILGDMNGIVTEEEYYNYVLFDRRPFDDGMPQFQDNYTGDLPITTFDYNSGKIDQYQLKDSARNQDAMINISGDTQVRQSFIPTSKILSKIMLKIDFWNYIDSQINIRIYDSNGICLAEEIEFYNAESSWRFWYKFDIKDVTVIPGKTYYVVCSIENEGHYNLWGSISDLYPNGEAKISENSGEYWFPNSISDLAFITFGIDQAENHKPYFTKKPSGSTNIQVGEEYNYSIYAIEPDGDKVYYKWDWGDGTESELPESYCSGELCDVSHIWNEKGDYKIKVIAKDSKGIQSEWSDTLDIIVGKIKSKNLLIFNFLERCPLLQQILKKI